MCPNGEEKSVDDAGAAPPPAQVEESTSAEGCLSILASFVGAASFQTFATLATIAAYNVARRKSADYVLMTFMVSYATNLLVTILLTRGMLRTSRQVAGAVFLLISVVSISLGGTCAFATFRKL